MQRLFLAVVALVVFTAAPAAQRNQKPAPPAKTATISYPERFDWQKRTPADAGFDQAKLDAATRDQTDASR